VDTDAFDYELPAERIAQTPVEPRHAARLLVQRPRGGLASSAGGKGRAGPAHRTVADLPDELQPGDLLVVNDTRVIPARLHLRRATGARVELLLLAEEGDRRWEALARPSRRVHAGDLLTDDHGLAVEVLEPMGEGRWRVRFPGDEPVSHLLAGHGEVPLPPYITTPLADPERYQTVYGSQPGSVAAPTAGLHLSSEVLARLEQRGVDLGRVELVVGLGTFRPIATAAVEDHVMHAETYRIDPDTARRIGEAPRVVAVGTTVVRALESWAATG
jgi:S-adenosylmethionine:tRNA ribosyltransferase-isomerase